MLASPIKVKLCCCMPLLLLVAPEEAGFNNIQGTATCLPLLEEPELREPLELVPPELLLEEPGSVELVPELLPEGLVAPPWAPLEAFKERIAKSIRPEPGLTTRSLMVPRFSPEEPLTSQPLS